MSEALTGVELGPDSCVLTRVSRRGAVTRISSTHVIEPERWPVGDSLLIEELQRVRREKDLPRRARVMFWSTATDISLGHPALGPLARAGFRVESVISPPQALALLAATRPRPAGSGAAAWLALNRHGAAIAIVSGGELLFARVFPWAYRVLNRPQEQLLQRYSLVAHLAPELRHGIDEVRQTRGVTVDSIVTCGDLPDLRSLTMPLTEELDLEVETLDTAEGLEIEGEARTDRVPDWLPAVRLASATAGAQRRSDPARAVMIGLTAAAALVTVAAIGFWVYSEFLSPLHRAPTHEARVVRPEPRQPNPVPRVPGGASQAAREGTPTANPPAASNAPTGTRGVVRTAPEPVRVPRPRPPSVHAEVDPEKAPLPQVNSILVAPDRRLAVLDGAIVREGEKVGPRVLLKIEQDAVILREPSGRDVRVPIRGRRGGTS